LPPVPHFLARGYAGDIPFLTDLIKKANRHKGFALIQVLSPCVSSFNQEYTHIFYRRQML
jgi:2-oxoglutarate ferredoxin oxidoreductase subunit beta